MAGEDSNDLDPQELTRDDVDRLPGLVLLEFGTEWCGFCRAVRPQVGTLLKKYPQVRHVSVEDGPGKPLGRSFRVKLWPTFVFLRDGQVVQLLVRPNPREIEQGFEALVAGPA